MNNMEMINFKCQDETLMKLFCPQPYMTAIKEMSARDGYAVNESVARLSIAVSCVVSLQVLYLFHYTCMRNIL
jgi:hypothetical protein